MSDLLLSVVIGTYKRASELRRCLSSVLSEPGDFFDVLVGDDGSPDDTPQVIADCTRDSRLRSYRNEQNLGMQENMLKVVREARGRFVFILTDDDALLAGTLGRVKQVLEENADIGYVLSHLPTVDNRTGKLVDLHRTFEASCRLSPGLPLMAKAVGSAWVLSRQVLRRDLIDWDTWQRYRDNVYFPIIVAGRLLLCAPSYYLAEPLVMHTWFNKVHWEKFGRNELEIQLRLARDRHHCMRAILHDRPNTPEISKIIEDWETQNLKTYLYLPRLGYLDLCASQREGAERILRETFPLSSSQERELAVFSRKRSFYRLWFGLRALIRLLPPSWLGELRSFRARRSAAVGR